MKQRKFTNSNQHWWHWEIAAKCDAWFSALYKYSYLLTYLRICYVCMFRVGTSCWLQPSSKYVLFNLLVCPSL